MSKAVKAVSKVFNIVAKPLQKIFGALMPKPPNPGATSSGNELKQVIRSSKEPARYVFGRAGTGALLAWAQEQPGNQQKGEQLHLVYVLSEGAIAGLDEIYVDQEPVAAAGDRIEYQLVTDATAPNAYLLDNSPDWQETQIGRDLSWVRVTLKYDPDYFASGIPDLLFEYRGRTDIYDPRTSTNGYSDNAALVILWYIRHRLHVPDDEILWDTFIDAANVCDEIVTNPDGSTERRYTVSGGFKADERKDRVLADLEAACAGSLIRVGGKFGLQVGAYYGPYELTIDEDMVIGTVTGQTEVSRADAVNTMRGKFVSPEQRWTETDYPAVSVSEWIIEDGEEIEDTLDLRLVSSPYQSQRLANIALRRKRAGGTLELPLNFRGYACRPGRVVQVDLPTLNILGEFRVVDWDFSGENGCKVTLQQEQPEIYDDAVGQPFDPFGFIQLPTGGIGSPTGLQYVLVNVGEVVQGRLVWNPVDAALHYNVVIKRDGVAVQAAQVPAGVERCDIGGLEAGTYTAEVRARGRLGQSSPATVGFSINVPPMPESVGISASNDSITLTPRLNSSYGRVEFEFRWHPTPLPLNQVAASAEYLSMGASYTHTGLTWGTDYHYYVRSVNAYGASPWLYVPASTTADVEQILQGLTGQIRESTLDQALREEIEKISGPESLDGSVAKRLAEEAAIRAQELADEALARAEGLTAEAQARAQALADEAQARADAIAAQAADFSAAIDAEALARANGLTAEAQARADALAAQAQQLTDAIDAVETQTAQAVADEQQARIDALDQERAERIDSFAAEAQARAQAIADETQNRTVAITELSEQVESEFGLLGLEINAIAAAYDATAASIYTMTQIRINEAEVVATQINQLSGRVDDNDALILDERQIRTNQFSSLATQVGILSARLDARPSLNSGFEPGADFDAWSATSGNAINAVTSGVYSGLQSALITSTDASANPNSGGVRRVIAPETAQEFAGHEIRLAIYAEQPDSGAAAEFALAYQIAGETVSWQRFTPSTEWAFYDVVVDVPEGTGTAEHAIAVWGDTSGAGNGVLLDRLLITFAETDIPEVTAAIEQIQQALVDQEQAVAQELSGFESQLNDNASALQNEITIRSTLTDALASDVLTLQASTQDNAAAITAEREAWTTETEALAQQLNQQSAQIEDGEAALEDLRTVSASEDEYLASLQRVLAAAEGVNAASYRYTVETRVTEWEAQTVVNEQLAAQIGDNVAALENESLVRATETEALAQQNSALAATVAENKSTLTQQQQTLATELEALSSSLLALSSDVDDNNAAILQEAQTRADALGAMAQQFSLLSAEVDDNNSTLTQQQQAFADELEALSSSLLALNSDVDDNSAALLQEAQTRADAVIALSQQLTQQTARIAEGEAALQEQRTVSASEDEYLASLQRVLAAAEGVNAASYRYTVETRITDWEAQTVVNEQLVAKIADNIASIENESLVRATETGALAQQLNFVQTQWDDNLSTAQQSLTSQINTVDDKTEANASALTAAITEWDDNLSTAQQSLTSQINTVDDKTEANASALTAAITEWDDNLSTAQQSLTSQINTVDDKTEANASALTAAVTQWDNNLSTAQQSLTSQINTVDNKTEANAAALTAAVTQWDNNLSTAQQSLTSEINTVNDKTEANAAALTAAVTQWDNNLSTAQQSLTSQINTVDDKTEANAAALTAAVTEWDNNLSTAQQSLTSQINTVDDKAEANAAALTLVTSAVEDNDAAIKSEATTRASAVTALAQQIDTVQIAFNEELASVQQATQVQYNETTQRLEAMWTLRIDNGGRVSGIGLADDGTESLLGFRADRIYFAHPNSSDEVFPMILDGGSVVMNDALINKLLFTKLRSSDGSLVFQGGKLQASYIAADQLSVEWGQIQNAWVTNAQIATAAIDSVKIRNAAVDTLHIKGQAVTIPLSAYTAGGITLGSEGGSNNVGGYRDYKDVQTLWVPSLPGTTEILCSFRVVFRIVNGSGWPEVRLVEWNGTDLTTRFHSRISEGLNTFAVVVPPKSGGRTFALQLKYGSNGMSDPGGLQFQAYNRFIRTLTLKDNP